MTKYLLIAVLLTACSRPPDCISIAGKVQPHQWTKWVDEDKKPSVPGFEAKLQQLQKRTCTACGACQLEWH